MVSKMGQGLTLASPVWRRLPTRPSVPQESSLRADPRGREQLTLSIPLTPIHGSSVVILDILLSFHGG